MVCKEGLGTDGVAGAVSLPKVRDTVCSLHMSPWVNLMEMSKHHELCSESWSHFTEQHWGQNPRGKNGGGNSLSEVHLGPIEKTEEDFYFIKFYWEREIEGQAI